MLHLGLDIGGTKMEAVLLDQHGNLHYSERRPTHKESYQGFLSNLLSMIESVRHRAEEEFTLGIGLPGAIDPQSGLIKNCNCLVLNGEDLKGDLIHQLKQPVFLANDADCFALSEAVDGAGAGYACVFGVIVGTGCGGGVVVNGNLLRGPNAIAGEWGHNPLPAMNQMNDGPAQYCYCGQENCIESFISGTGFARRFNETHGTLFTTEAIMDFVQKQEAHAVAHYQHFIDAFARSLASAINILDPHAIVIGGGLSNVEQIYQDLPKVIEKYIFSTHCRTAILKAKYGDSSGVRGAAWLPTLT